MNPDTIHIVKPTSVDELTACVRENTRVRLRGGGSKTALSCQGESATCIDMTGLSGMLEYQPDEFTFTAYAGTRVSEVERALAEHSQYLPFDPVLVGKGATLGGSVASGLSGPGRYRYGGARDFLLGVRFIDGQGNLVRGGGKVVKNAAGFDLPKLMVGSLGVFGALVELSFKVFPQPAAYTTLRFEYPRIEEAIAGMVALAYKPLEVYALDLDAGENGAALLVRLGGLPEAFSKRNERVRRILQLEEAARLVAGEDASFWRLRNEFEWVAPEFSLVKVPLTPKRVLPLDKVVKRAGAQRCYSVGANLAWVAWPAALSELDALLRELELAGLVILGSAGQPCLGVRPGESFTRRIQAALDPDGKFNRSDEHAT